MSWHFAKAGPQPHLPPRGEIQALVDAGKSDPEIAKHYGHSTGWAQGVRSRYGIAPAYQSGGLGRKRARAAVSAEARLFGDAAHEARYAQFFAEHGRYPDYDASDIARERQAYQAKRALSQGGLMSRCQFIEGAKRRAAE